MNEHSVTEQMSGGSVVSNPPRHAHDDYSSGGMRGRPGFNPDALHSARAQIERLTAVRAPLGGVHRGARRAES
jgi:hypothetical protein